ncbi:MAG: c-type cytochrome [Armatimonadota bacterium]
MSAAPVLVLVALLVAPPTDTVRAARGPTYRSGFDLAMGPHGERLYVSDRTAGCVVIIELPEAKKAGEIRLRGEPAGMALSPDGSRLYVAEYGAGSVAAVDCTQQRVLWRASVAPRPIGLALAPTRELLLVCNSDRDDVSLLNAVNGKETQRIRLTREPRWAAVTPDESQLVVANALPSGSAQDATLAAVVSLVDVDTREVTAVQLPTGSTNLRQVRVSPDGKWAYVVHNLGRFNVPPTQLERGWVNTNALTIIDLKQRALYATLLLDHLQEGAADPFGLALSADGNALWVSLSGLPEVLAIDLGKLHPMLAGQIPEHLAKAPGYDLGVQNSWQAIGKDVSARAELVNDLAALHQADALRRIKTGGSGPRGICLSGDGSTVYVAHFYSGEVVALDADNGRESARVALGPQPAPDLIRQGEELFHSASVCFQHWQSCASCHPDARMDGLRWDLQNDGMGNPKKTRSLVKSHQTSPVMSLGVREEAEAAVAAGFRFILFAVPQPKQTKAVNAYLRSLEPQPSPHLDRRGRLTPAAKRGKKLFEGPAECADCHSGPLLTDMERYDVGTLGELDDPDDKFATVKLLELYRVAPYLHDARAATLEEVLTKYNPEDKHGKTSQLSPDQVADLVAYLLSL